MGDVFDQDLSAVIANGADANLPVPDTDVPMVVARYAYRSMWTSAPYRRKGASEIRLWTVEFPDPRNGGHVGRSRA